MARLEPRDWSQCPVVESVPGRCGGAPVLVGSRIMVSTIVGNWEYGASVDDIMEWFELRPEQREQVEAVIAFAEAHGV